jgi:hypothetical protein
MLYPAELRALTGPSWRVPPDRLPSPFHGAEGNRTPDLLNAIQALSQLSYGPDP